MPAKSGLNNEQILLFEEKVNTSTEANFFRQKSHFDECYGIKASAKPGFTIDSVKNDSKEDPFEGSDTCRCSNSIKDSGCK